MPFYADEELKQENINLEPKTSSFISDDELLSNGINLNNNSSFKPVQNGTPLQQPAAQNVIQPQNQIQPQQNQVVNNVQPVIQQGSVSKQVFDYNGWVSDRPTLNPVANAGKDAAELVGGLAQLLGQGAVGTWNAVTHPKETINTIGNFGKSIGNDISNTQNVANALITNSLNGNFNQVPNNLDTYRKNIRQNHPVLSTLKDALVQGIKEQYGQGDRSILKDGVDLKEFGKSFLKHPLLNGLDVVGAGEIGKIDKISDAIRAAETMKNIKTGASQAANRQARIDAKVAELKSKGEKVPNNIAEQFQDVVHYDDKGNKYRLDINGNPQYFDKPTENLVLKPIDYALQSEPVQRLVQATDGSVQNLLGTFAGMKENNPLLGKQASARARLRQLEKDRKSKTNQQLIDAERENNQNFANLTDEQGKDIVKDIEGKTEATNPNIEIPNTKVTENSGDVLKGQIIKNETPEIPNSKNVTSDADSLKGEVVRDNVAQTGNIINKTNADGIVEINGKFYWDNAKGEIPDNIAPEKMNGVIIDGKSYVEIGDVPKDLKQVEQPFEAITDNAKNIAKTEEKFAGEYTADGAEMPTMKNPEVEPVKSPVTEENNVVDNSIPKEQETPINDVPRSKEDIQNEIAQINQELKNARRKGMPKQKRAELIHEKNARLKELRNELKEQNQKPIEIESNNTNVQQNPANAFIGKSSNAKDKVNKVDLQERYNEAIKNNNETAKRKIRREEKQYDLEEKYKNGDIDEKTYKTEKFLDDFQTFLDNDNQDADIISLFKKHRDILGDELGKMVDEIPNNITSKRFYDDKTASIDKNNRFEFGFYDYNRSDVVEKSFHEFAHAIDNNNNITNEFDDISKNTKFFNRFTGKDETIKAKWGTPAKMTAGERASLAKFLAHEKVKKSLIKAIQDGQKSGVINVVDITNIDGTISSIRIPYKDVSKFKTPEKILENIGKYFHKCYMAHPTEQYAFKRGLKAKELYDKIKSEQRSKYKFRSNLKGENNETESNLYIQWNNDRSSNRPYGERNNGWKQIQSNIKGRGTTSSYSYIGKSTRKDSEVVNALFDTKNKFKNKLKQNSDFYKSIGRLTDDTENANIIDTFAAYKNGITKRDKITDSMREEALKVINSLPEDKKPFYVPRMYDEHLTKADFGLGHYRQLDDIDELKHRSYTGDADKIKNGKLTRNFNIEKIANRLDEHRIKLDNMSKYIDDITNSLAKPLDKIENLQKGYVAFNPEKIKSVFFGKTNFEDLVVDGLKEHRSIEASLKNALQKNADELKTDAEEVLQKLQNSTDNLYQIPEKVYEDLVNSVSYKSNKALNIWDIGTDAFKKNVLGLNAKWVINNRIGNTIMAAFKGTNLLNPMNVKRISKLTDDLFPAELTGETFHSSERMGKLKSTGYKGLDNVLSLLDGNSVNDSKVLSSLSLPGKIVNKISKTVFDTNQKFEVMDRKTAYLKGIDNKKKEILKATGKKFMSDKELLTYAKNNPKLKKEILKHVDDTLGDYSSMSHIERSVIKRIIPFYSWLRTITRHTLSLPKTNPIRTSIMSKISAFSHEERDDLPFYQKNAVDTDYKSEKDSRELMLNYEHSVPYSTFGESGENPMSLFDPAIKNAVDAAAGVNTYNGMPLVSKRYASNTGGGYIDTKGGGEIENLPASEKTKAYLIKTLRDKLPGLKQTERVLGGIMFSKEHKPYDKLYDTDFGGYMEEDIRKNAKGWSGKEQLLRYVLPIQKKGKVTKNKNNYRYKKAHKRMLNKE